jgi:hypothetical protein
MLSDYWNGVLVRGLTFVLFMISFGVMITTPAAIMKAGTGFAMPSIFGVMLFGFMLVFIGNE